MLAACEAGEVFALLEGGGAAARAASDALGAALAAVREPWPARALLHYHARTGSARALDLLARLSETHARHLLDALHDQLRGERAQRHHALAALAPLVARRPSWLHLLAAHPAARELMRAARTERERLPLVHALLALAALVPGAPSLAAAHAGELAEAAARGTADADAGAGAGAHVAVAARALFRATYATHPAAAVEALRAACAEAGGRGTAWERGAAALARGVRLHPALVGARPRDWARAEPHDVLAEVRRLSLPPRDDAPPAAPAPDAEPPRARRSDPDAPVAVQPPPGSTAQAARALSSVRPGGEGWFGLAERSGAEGAPHTPLPADADGAEPEPAVEATPENTPARDVRAAFPFPPPGAGAGAGEGAARALAVRRASPPRDALSARLARVAAERRAADSPVPMGGAPPPAAPRPEPRRAPPAPLDAEDREVQGLTARAPPPADWPEAEGAARGPDPRRAAAPLARPPHPAPPPRRPASAGPPGGRRTDAATQTLDAWPEPYEYIVADFSGALADDLGPDQKAESGGARARLDAYLASLYAGRGGGGGAGAGAGCELGEQLALAHAQLLYERWRREAHAERNRRLLGRCRQVRALELSNAALKERARDACRERDLLRAAAVRRDDAPAPAPAPGAPAPAPPALLLQLEEERARRLRAEAALREAEGALAAGAGELQRARGAGAEAARHVEALARAALAAERRADHVRRLRRELLALGEREARLAAALQAAPVAPAPDPGTERALRAALARADQEAEAAGARAEAACARAADLETALAARDAHNAELKRALRAAGEEAAAQNAALADKYRALLAALRAQDARHLERLAAACLARPAPAPDH